MKIRFYWLSVYFLFLVNPSFSQQYNQKSTNNKTGDEILISYCTRSALESSNYREWFNSAYNGYKNQLDKSRLDSMKIFLTNVKVAIVMGTWCSDSREQVPPFFLMTDYLGLKSKNIQIICVDHDRKAPGVDTDKLNILKVPTFIIYKNKQEIGRIIETPILSLEKDLLKILQSSSAD